MGKVRLSEETLIKAMTSDQTRAALAERADRIAGQASARVSAHGAKVDVERSDGTRPKGRPFSRVALSSSDPEHPVPPLVRRAMLENSQ